MFRYISEIKFLRQMFWQFKMKQCPHPEHRVCCIHGEQITLFKSRRSVCMDCYKSFKTFPKICKIASIRFGCTIYHTDIDNE